MRQFIDENDFGAPGNDGVQVQLLDFNPSIRDPSKGDGLQTSEQKAGLFPSVRLDEARDDIDPILPETVRLKEHFVGLPHTRAVAEVYLELAPLRLADQP